MTVRYTKGTKLLVSATYEVQVEIDEDGVYTPQDLYGLVTNALLQTGDMDAHLADCKVICETDPEGIVHTTHEAVSRETEDEDDSDWQEQEKLDEAKDVWNDLRAGKEHTKTTDGKPAYPDLTPQQLQFVSDCLDQGLDVRTYSGRGMFGRYCPGVVVSHPSEVRTKVKYSYDSMGMDMIVYVS